VLVNILILVVYFSVDYAQTHTVWRLADMDATTDYWRIKDSDWLPWTDETGAAYLTDQTTTSEAEIERADRAGGQQRTRTLVRMRCFGTTDRLKTH
jgi:hypothetical protein